MDDETVSLEDTKVDEETLKEVNMLLGKASPEKALERGKTLAHHLLDDRYLLKTTRISMREVNLSGYALFVGSRYRGMDWLTDVVRNKMRLRVSTAGPGGKGRDEIVKLGAPVVVRSSSKPVRSFSPFREPG